MVVGAVYDRAQLNDGACAVIDRACNSAAIEVPDYEAQSEGHISKLFR
jgi:hypothetical protein